MSANVVLREPAPRWVEAPRLWPRRAFPAYRFVTGLNPHPARDPEGHCCGIPQASAVLPPSRWRENEPYLYGIDLYHQGYLWESHEAWEEVWRLLPRTDVQARYLQGLIKNSAAQLKAHTDTVRGAYIHSLDAYELLNSVWDAGVCDADRRFMGLDVPEFMGQMERHYGALWDDGPKGALQLVGPAPRLKLR